MLPFVHKSSFPKEWKLPIFFQLIQCTASSSYSGLTVPGLVDFCGVGTQNSFLVPNAEIRFLGRNLTGALGP